MFVLSVLMLAYETGSAKGSSVTGSFSDDTSITINYQLDPNSPLVPLADTNGDTFTLTALNGGNELIQTTGNITGGAGFYIVGGFAGGNYGTIGTSYSAGDVKVTGTTTQSNSFYTGGFAGVNSGTISNVYATGNATSFTSHGPNPADQTGVVGGLVAQQNAGGISYAYSLGAVTGGTTRGGLVGVNAAGGITKSFWDLDNNPGLAYSAGGAGALGVSDASLMTDTADFSTSVFGHAKWNNKTVWLVPGANGYITLQGVP